MLKRAMFMLTATCSSVVLGTPAPGRSLRFSSQAEERFEDLDKAFP